MKKIFVIFYCLALCQSTFIFAQSGADDNDRVISGDVCDDGSVLVTIPDINICSTKYGIASECTVCAFCGDGVLNPDAPLSEQCDTNVFSEQFSSYSPKICAADCTVKYCGDGILTATAPLSEQCDGTLFASDFMRISPRDCSENCRVEYCGDGIRQTAAPLNEQCDRSDPAGVECQPNCRQKGCGDGYVDSPETCDPYIADGQPGYIKDCRPVGHTAQCTYCGDNEIQADEACDDTAKGTVTDPDAVCKADCSGFDPYCGDGTPGNTANEQCDDGNTSNADTCTNACTTARCGDDFVQNGEDCDDGNNDNTDNCSNACTIAACGDGILQFGEECDDSGVIDGDGCSAICKNECTDASLPQINSVDSIDVGYATSSINHTVGFVNDTSRSIVNGASWVNQSQGSINIAIASTGSTCSTSRWRYGWCDCEPWDAYTGVDSCNQTGFWSHRTCNLYTTTCTNTGKGEVNLSANNICGNKTKKIVVNQSYTTSSSGWEYTGQGDSPVSLYIGDAESLKNKELFPARSAFKLAANQENLEVLWFASSSSPLLIWDPENTGIVADGRTLFGSWYLGKQWKDGYQALASLDANQNGVLTDAELKGIRLWFDHNQNAKVDEMEIGDLAHLGIVEINTKYNQHTVMELYDVTMLIADSGYKTKDSDGKIKVSPSFDWFVPTQKLDALSWDKKLKELESQGYLIRKWAEDPLEDFPSDFNGYLVYKRSQNKLTGFSASQVVWEAKDLQLPPDFKGNAQGFKAPVVERQYAVQQINFSADISKDGKVIIKLPFENSTTELLASISGSELTPLKLKRSRRNKGAGNSNAVALEKNWKLINDQSAPMLYR